MSYPQDSIIGLKLFIFYVSDMCNIPKLVEYALFVDDDIFMQITIITIILNEVVCNVLYTIWTCFVKLRLNIFKL